MMRKFPIAGLALVAVFAFSVFAVASASALESGWLVSGAAAGKELVLSEGELLLSDLKVPILGAVTILCSGLNEGWVGWDAKDGLNIKYDEITNITGLNPSTEPLWIKCVLQEGGCESSTVVEAMPVHLPWLSEVLLVGGVFVVDLRGSVAGEPPGWVVRNCLAFGVLQAEDECTKEERSLGVENLAEDVLLLFEAIEPALCSLSKEESGDVEGSVLIFTESGLSLALSEG